MNMNELLDVPGKSCDGLTVVISALKGRRLGKAPTIARLAA
jgi:hypothetical protein